MDKSRGTKFRIVASIICGTTIWYFLQITLLAPRFSDNLWTHDDDDDDDDDDISHKLLQGLDESWLNGLDYSTQVENKKGQQNFCRDPLDQRGSKFERQVAVVTKFL